MVQKFEWQRGTRHVIADSTVAAIRRAVFASDAAAERYVEIAEAYNRDSEAGRVSARDEFDREHEVGQAKIAFEEAARRRRAIVVAARAEYAAANPGAEKWADVVVGDFVTAAHIDYAEGAEAAAAEE